MIFPWHEVNSSSLGSISSYIRKADKSLTFKGFPEELD